MLYLNEYRHAHIRSLYYLQLLRHLAANAFYAYWDCSNNRISADQSLLSSWSSRKSGMATNKGYWRFKSCTKVYAHMLMSILACESASRYKGALRTSLQIPNQANTPLDISSYSISNSMLLYIFQLLLSILVIICFNIRKV